MGSQQNKLIIFRYKYLKYSSYHYIDFIVLGYTLTNNVITLSFLYHKNLVKRSKIIVLLIQIRNLICLHLAFLAQNQNIT
jgi:hypothetical protein